ncbi:hypothetical protein D3C84_873240 [compost metagenome]
MAGRILELKLVAIPRLEAGYKQHPVTTLAALHRVAATVPEVEVADQAHRSGARRIDGEAHPFHPLAEVFHGAQLGAQGVIEVLRLERQLRQSLPGGSLKLIGVDTLGAGIGVTGDQLIREGVLATGENSFKKARFIGGSQGGNQLAGLEILDANLEGIGQPGGQFQAWSIRVSQQA